MQKLSEIILVMCINEGNQPGCQLAARENLSSGSKRNKLALLILSQSYKRVACEVNMTSREEKPSYLAL
jgi:hypothetical protein